MGSVKGVVATLPFSKTSFSEKPLSVDQEFIRKPTDIVLANLQNVDFGTYEIVKSFQVDRSSEGILNVIDSISTLVKNYLTISILKSTIPEGLNYKSLLATNSPEAFRHYIQGDKAFYKNDFHAAIGWFKQARLFIFLSKKTILSLKKKN